MNRGKNAWTVGHLANELWKVRLDVENFQRPADALELQVFATGIINYWTIDWLFAVYQNKGNCISGDLKYKHGRMCSNDYVLRIIRDFKDSDHPLFTDEVTEQFLYLELLYNKSQDRMLTTSEYEDFKKMYHAIQRESYDIVTALLKDFNPYKKIKLKENDRKIS